MIEMSPLLLLAIGVGAIILLLFIQLVYDVVRIIVAAKGRCIFVMNEHTDALGKKLLAECIICDNRLIIWKWEELEEHELE